MLDTDKNDVLHKSDNKSENKKDRAELEKSHEYKQIRIT